MMGLRAAKTNTEKLKYLWAMGKDVGLRIWNGFKELYRNTKEARHLKRQKKFELYTITHSREGVVLTIRQERFIWQNSIDLRHLIPFFIVYKIPILGHFILPFFVARFPELLPSTIRLSKQVLHISTFQAKFRSQPSNNKYYHRN